MNKKILAGITVILLIWNVNAIRVGVVVEFPDGKIHRECIFLSENTDGYETMKKTSLDISWSEPGPFGHAMCGIEDTGCPTENCWCTSQYWGFYTLKPGENSWSYSPIGFDGGSTCNEHYCAKDGDMLGFAYGDFGTKPKVFTFNDVCPKLRRREEKTFKAIIQPTDPHNEETIKITILDSQDNPIPETEIEIYAGKAGISKPVFSAKTDEKGETAFTLQDGGDYQIRINARECSPPQKYIDLTVTALPPKTTTTTTSTTTTTTTTTTTSTRTTTTTSTTTTTTTTTSTSTTTTTLETPKATGKVAAVSGYDTVLGAFFVIISAVVYTVYKKGLIR